MVFVVMAFRLGPMVRRPRRKLRTKKVGEKGEAHIVLPTQRQCRRRLLLIHLAPATLVMFKKIHQPWDIHMKMTPTQKKGKHKETTPGTSKARSQEVFQLLPKPLGTFALGTQPPCREEAQAKGLIWRRTKTLTDSPSWATTCSWEWAIWKTCLRVSTGPT